MDLSLVYLPSAVMLGALHALEPGHAKTLTAAYLIGIKGKARDALVLGVTVALTHSAVVLGLAAGAVWLGREAFTDIGIWYLSVISSTVVICLGSWLAYRRWPRQHHHHHDHHHDEEGDHSHPEHEHDHQHLDEDAHARAHQAALPEYVHRGERPTTLQIIGFGAAGGLVPCPAAVSVMLLALSVSQSARGMLLVAGFSVGLALTLAGLGMAVVFGLSSLEHTGLLSRFSRKAPIAAALLVVLSGIAGLCVALIHGVQPLEQF